MAVLLVILLRLLVPLAIFRWPLAGGVAALLLDGADVILLDLFIKIWGGGPGFESFGFNYSALDKWLDVYYLSFEAIVAFSWTQLARNTSLALFAFRLIGMVLFEATGTRKLLFLFPNLFENFYLYHLITRRWFPRLVPKNLRQLSLVLFVLYVPKFGQEWILHIAELKPWVWMRETFLLTK